jgi:hypothetical protein
MADAEEREKTMPVVIHFVVSHEQAELIDSAIEPETPDRYIQRCGACREAAVGRHRSIPQATIGLGKDQAHRRPDGFLGEE